MVDPHARRNFGTLVAAAFVDGTLSDPEKQLLHRKATEMNIPVRLVSEFLGQGREGKLSVAVPATAQGKEEMLDDLIDVVCADGRVEAPEHHLLAKFAAHVGLALPDLRGRVKERLQRRPPRPTRVEPRIEEIRISDEPPRPAGSSPPPAAPGPLDAPPPGPLSLLEPPPAIGTPALAGSPLADIPPVTLHLIKQAMIFERPEDAIRYIERMMSVTRPEAQRIVDVVRAAHPELNPGSMQIRPPSR